MDRQIHTATLLPDGRVLVAGGFSKSGRDVEERADLYDPSANSWAATALMNVARVDHTATLLPSGGVLVAGGRELSSAAALPSAELYAVSSPTTTLPCTTARCILEAAVTSRACAADPIPSAVTAMVNDAANLIERAEARPANRA